MRVTITLGALGAIALAGAAQATPFQGFTVDHLGNLEGDGETYRMYVNLDAGSRIDAVFGNSVGNLSIEVDGGSFYQNALGGPTSQSINSAFFPLAPSLEWDSYVTVGELYAGPTNALMDIGIDWASFESGGELATDNGSWFCTPVDAQGEEVG